MSEKGEKMPDTFRDKSGRLYVRITEEFFFGDGTNVMKLGGDFLKTGKAAMPVDDEEE